MKRGRERPHQGAPRHAGKGSLAKFLTRHRGIRNKSDLPSLTVDQIKAWAEAHHTRTGSWPAAHSGKIHDAPGESWSAVHSALTSGLRGLPGGDSLARLLERECGRRNPAEVPRLTLVGIRRWVVRHHELTGKWPKALSGPIAGVEGETWGAVANALQKGRRGLRAGARTLAGGAGVPEGVKSILTLPSAENHLGHSNVV